MRPGALVSALGRWEEAVRRSQRTGTAETFHDCDCGEPPAYWYRDLLERAQHGLPAESRRRLAGQVHKLDTRYEEATSPDPTAPAYLPWWLRRFGGYPRSFRWTA
jgi:hypothetical protein